MLPWIEISHHMTNKKTTNKYILMFVAALEGYTVIFCISIFSLQTSDIAYAVCIHFFAQVVYKRTNKYPIMHIRYTPTDVEVFFFFFFQINIKSLPIYCENMLRYSITKAQYVFPLQLYCSVMFNSF